MNRLGYLVPEFPAQTHIFFWRELQSLAAMGVDCDLVSTRHPARRLMSHSWSQEAMARTTYLSPPTISSLLSGLAIAFKSGPMGWARVLSGVMKSEAGSLKRRMRLAALAVVGAQLAGIAKQRRWDHLHVHSCADAANVAMFAHLFTGLPYSMTLHGPLSDYGPNQAMKWQHAAFAIVITRKLLAEVKAELNSSTPPCIEIAPMGVNLAKFIRQNAYSPWTGNGAFNVFSCGRLNFCKGHDDLVRGTALLRDRGIDARLKIAGADDSDGSYRATLEKLISELSLNDRVQLLGAVDEESVRGGIEAAHVFSLASLQEPLGVAIMEAMAMQSPVVVTRAGGVPELVGDGIDGILVDPRNPACLADALEKLARDPALAARLSSAGRAKIERSFQSDQSARVLANHLASAANSGANPSDGAQ